MIGWYAVYTQPRFELWARTNLWERGLEVYLPQYRRRVRHARQVRDIVTPYFPRYLFVQADPELGDRRKIDSAKGVVGMVRFGDCTPPVPDAVMKELRAREGEDGLIRMDGGPRFKPGEKVRLLGGALADQVGVFETATDAQRVIVLLELLGRQTRVRIAADALVAEG